jgi:multisubunit Na+/H+ antiporter MnhC subunit
MGFLVLIYGVVIGITFAGYTLKEFIDSYDGYRDKSWKELPKVIGIAMLITSLVIAFGFVLFILVTLAGGLPGLKK